VTDGAASLERALAGRYTIERELGRGGMAVVYLARDVRHDRPVALKVLHPDLAHALGPERFQREIHVAARLQHPHILGVHDSGDADGLLWFAMPFVEGESLRDRLARDKQLPVEDALRIAREAADALDYAHRHGVVHRDIKPENILLSDGHALVADFGIARALAGGGGGEQLTATGTSIGTAAYMSPEQAAGEREVDGRSDLFSLGIVLYEMLAGVTPFAGATPQATIARRFTEDAAPVRRLRPSVPEGVERALQQALARTAADRYPTARAFADALGPGAATRRPERVRLTPRALVLIVGLLLGVGALFAWSRDGERSGAATASPVGTTASGSLGLAVLPFENLGDTADAYFADGVTDAVRGKLAGIDGFAVIARGSSQEYGATDKTAVQIADELGVRYLLTGTVRWVKQPDGTSRVQVRPELVEIGDGTAHTRWGEAFNAPLTDVFEVQEQIAGRVSGALDVVLGSPDQARLAERPTADLAAYNLFLQAEAITRRDAVSIRRVMSLYEQVVARDPAFGIAWARLATVRAYLAANRTHGLERDRLREALDRAMALAPHAAATYRARMAYATGIERDRAAAVAIGEEGVRRYHNEPELLRSLGALKVSLGDVEAGAGLLERAVALDPRNPGTFYVLGNARLQVAQFKAAREAFRRALDLGPGDPRNARALVQGWIAEGDLAGARRTLESIRTPDDRQELLVGLSVTGDDYWVLDRAQQDTVMGLGLEWFDGDAGSRDLVSAQVLHARGDTAGARRFAQAARRDLERGAAANPDPQLPALIGLTFALQGSHAEARRRLSRALASTREDDASSRSYILELTARAEMFAGNHEAALSALERGIRPVDAGRIRIHPDFAALREHPLFRRITAPRLAPDRSRT